MADLLICSAAERDYADALCWYTERSVQAAELFEHEFGQALATIVADPDRFPRCDDRHRYYLMHRFPYQVIYRRHEEQVVVIAIAHTAREPGYWANR